MKCRHLVISDEAYCNGQAVAVFLCAWPASKLGPMKPAWVDRAIGGGLMINHETECPACPCFEKQGADHG